MNKADLWFLVVLLLSVSTGFLISVDRERFFVRIQEYAHERQIRIELPNVVLPDFQKHTQMIPPGTPQVNPQPAEDVEPTSAIHTWPSYILTAGERHIHTFAYARSRSGTTYGEIYKWHDYLVWYDQIRNGTHVTIAFYSYNTLTHAKYHLFSSQEDRYRSCKEVNRVTFTDNLLNIDCTVHVKFTYPPVPASMTISDDPAPTVPNDGETSSTTSLIEQFGHLDLPSEYTLTPIYD